MHSLPRTVLILLLVVLLFGCQQRSTRGLVLPEGNAEQGQALFVDLQCNACHSIKGMDLPAAPVDREFNFALGGRGLKTYPELVTSIINPSHRIARGYRPDDSDPENSSPMSNYNDVLTVTELVNLVSFLQTQYKVEPVTRYRYVPYRYPGED